MFHGEIFSNKPGFVFCTKAEKLSSLFTPKSLNYNPFKEDVLT